jgi:hypothetical protein
VINARNLRCQEIQKGVDPLAASDVTNSNSMTSRDIEQRDSLKRDYERQAREAWDSISKNIPKGN